MDILAPTLKERLAFQFKVIIFCAFVVGTQHVQTAWAQSVSETDPSQDGPAAYQSQVSGDFIGGAFDVSTSSDGTPEVRGIFIPASRWVTPTMAEPGELRFHENGADRTMVATPRAVPGTKSYVKSKGGRFMAVVTRDPRNGASSTDIYDLDGTLVGSLPRRVVGLSKNMRFAALAGYSQVADLKNGKLINLGLPSDSANHRLQLAEDSDAFISSYRREKKIYVASFGEDGALKWRESVASSTAPYLRNTSMSPSGEYVAVIAGEVPIDHLSIFNAAGALLWTKNIPSGNYAMSFTSDSSKLFLIYRDGQMLLNAASGTTLWDKSFPLKDISERGSLIATKIINTGSTFVVATRSVLSNEPGKRPFQTGDRASGPDLIYTVDESGRIKVQMQRPRGALLVEVGRFHFEPIVTVNGSRIYYLTRRGVRSKSIR